MYYCKDMYVFGKLQLKRRLGYVPYFDPHESMSALFEGHLTVTHPTCKNYFITTPLVSKWKGGVLRGRNKSIK